MSIRSTRIEQAVSKQAESMIQKNAEWLRKSRERPAVWRGWLNIFFTFLLIYVLPALPMVMMRGAHADPLLAHAWWCIWSFGALLLVSGGLASLWFGPAGEVTALENLPLSDGSVFDFQWQEFVDGTWTRFFGAIVAGVILMPEWKFELLPCVGLIVFGIAYWQGSIAVNAILVALNRSAICTWLGLLLMGGVMTLFVLWNPVFAKFVDAFFLIARNIIPLLPVAWGWELCHGVTGASFNHALFIFPFGLLLWLKSWAIVHMRSMYVYREIDVASTDSVDAELATGFEISGDRLTVIAPNKLDSANAVAAVKTREFLNSPPYEEAFGFQEKVFHRWLNARERMILMSYGAFPLKLTRGWIASWKTALLVTLVILLWPFEAAWLIGVNLIGLLILCCFSLSAGAVVCRAEDGVTDPSGNVLSFHSGYPVTLSELRRIAGKAGIVRGIFAMFPLGFFGFLSGVANDAEWAIQWYGTFSGVQRGWYGLETGVELALVWASTYPMIWMLSVNSNSRSNNNPTQTLLDFVVVVPLSLGLFGTGFTLFMVVGNPIVTATGLFLAALFSWGGSAYLLRTMDSSRVDCIHRNDDGMPGA